MDGGEKGHTRRGHRRGVAEPEHEEVGCQEDNRQTAAEHGEGIGIDTNLTRSG